MNDGAHAVLAKQAFAKEYLDLLRALTTVLAWSALCLAVGVLVWRSDMRATYGITYETISAIVTLVAATTTVGAWYSFLIMYQQMHGRMGRDTPWSLTIPLACLNPYGLVFFAIVALAVMLLPMIKNLAALAP